MFVSDTSTDPRHRERAISDDIVRLRQWGTNQSYELPALGTDCLIGSASSCTIRLDDSRVSSQHARLLLDREGRWNLIDLSSKNGVRVDGVRQYTARLEPCMAIGLGRLTLLAESPRSIDLRSFLSRILGWGADSYEAVDLALQEIRNAQIRRGPFVLQGEGNLVPVVHDLHRYMYGDGAPFVTCDPRNGELPPSTRTPRNFRDWRVALAAARGGTLCIPNARPPAALPELLTEVRDSVPAVQLVVWTPLPHQSPCVTGTTPIKIPALSSRSHAQLEHIVVEYAMDALLHLGTDKPLTAADQAWVLATAAEGNPLSLGAIAKSTLRLSALRMGGGFNATAKRLGMTAISLRKWFARRARPDGLSEDEEKSLSLMDREAEE